MSMKRPQNRLLGIVALSGLSVGQWAIPGVGAAGLLPDQIYPCVQDPRGMKSADFNADGLPDLVVAGQNKPWSSVLLGRLDGTFDSSSIPGTFSNDLAVGDFNGDGHIDVVEPTGGDIDFHAGRGDGTFEPPVSSGCSACEDYWWLQAVDLTEDGQLDLVATTYDSAPISGLSFADFLLLGDGAGGFAEPMVLTEAGSSGSVGIADFDEDGHLDFVDAVGGRDEVCLYFGNGNGTFDHDPAQDCLAGGAILNGWVMGTGDLDRDGNVDLVVQDLQAHALLVLLGDGAGAFGPPTSTPFDIRPYGANLADVTGDGILDVVGIGGSRLKVLAGTGTGGFEAERQVATAGFGPLAFEDFDADGNPDIAWAGVSSSLVQVVRGHRDGSFSGSMIGEIIVDGGFAKGLAAGDFDTDAKTDVAVAQGMTPGQVTVFFGDGAGGAQDSAVVATGDQTCTLTAAHVDVGPTLDLIAGNCGSFDASVLLGNGDGSFAPEQRLALGTAPRQIATGDFNHDAHPDLAVLGLAPDNTVRLFLGGGDGSFTAAVQRTVGEGPSSIAVADLDGDSSMDIVVANELSNDLSFLIGDGVGGVAEELRLDVGGSPRQVVVSDLNRDSRPDLVLRFDSAQVGIAVLYGLAAGAFSAPMAIPLPVDVAWYPPRELLVGDFDGNRYPDLLVKTLFSATLFLGSADGVFRVDGHYTTWASNPVLTDLDGDLRADVVLHTSATLQILINQGPSFTTFESDKITLAWPTASDAHSYNVYRGNLNDLFDADQDGLPDSGYGVCIAAPDVTTTDNSLVDTELPSSRQGFFYLPSVVDALGERGLGTTHSGVSRPVPGCP